MSDRPTSVWILGQPFSVTWIDGDNDVLSDRSRMGHGNLAQQRITVDAHQGADQLRDTFLHEVLHQCFNIVGALDDEREQEQAVLALSPVLLQVLRENSGMVSWLVAA